jgi:hypothetical protein
VATAVIITRTMAAITVTTVGTVIGVMGVGSLSELALPQSLARPEPMIATAIGVMAIAIATKLIQIDCISAPALKKAGVFSLGLSHKASFILNFFHPQLSSNIF